MSSSTDPYQPVEAQEQITRSLLETMLMELPDFILVQTRSPLVTRDIDLLQKLGERVRVSMTVETDQDDIRKHFTPLRHLLQVAYTHLNYYGMPASLTLLLLRLYCRAVNSLPLRLDRSFNVCASMIILWVTAVRASGHGDLGWRSLSGDRNAALVSAAGLPNGCGANEDAFCRTGDLY